MFFNIIHKSEAYYLCCYQKRSYTESIGRSFSYQYLSLQFFIVRGYNGRFQDFKVEHGKILDKIIVIGNQLSNHRTVYKKQLLLKQHFFKKPAIFKAILG